MKILIFALVLLGVAFAQPSPDEAIDQCMETCCYSNGGTPSDSGRDCSIDPSDEKYNDLSDCQLQCVYQGTGVDTGAGACCCGPALILFALMGLALKRGSG